MIACETLCAITGSIPDKYIPLEAVVIPQLSLERILCHDHISHIMMEIAITVVISIVQYTNN